MIYNMRRRKKKVSLKWYFNSRLSILENRTYTANFTSNGRTFIELITDTSSWSGGFAYGFYAYGGNRKDIVYSTKTNTWKAEAYRTVEFEEEPTGELLAFLQQNATPL